MGVTKHGEGNNHHPIFHNWQFFQQGITNANMKISLPFATHESN